MAASKSNNEFFHQVKASQLDRQLWWCLRMEQQENLIVSPALLEFIGHPISKLEDFIPDETLSIVKQHIHDFANAQHNDTFPSKRFISLVQIASGDYVLQHVMNYYHDDRGGLLWVNCTDISDWVHINEEGEIVCNTTHSQNADKRPESDESLYFSESEKQQFLLKQNRIIKESYEKQSRFLALLSHELRSPLLGISSLVKRLKEALNGNASAEILSMLKTISMTAEQSTYLVNDILTYTQTQHAGIKLRPAKIQLSELLSNVKLLTKSIANDKGLSLTVESEFKHDEVWVDTIRLTQILINLIINAIKFTQTGGVKVKVKEVEDYKFQFSIADSGEGIPTEYLHEIFKPFAQIESTTGKGVLGLGLGLFVVKQLVELMHGRLEVLSKPHAGTEFSFILELHQQQATEVAAMVSEAADKTASVTGTLLQTQPKYEEVVEPVAGMKTAKTLVSLRVLVADDSEINRMVLAGYLSDLDCEVVEAADGLQAWQYLQRHEIDEQFDYVMLDIQMPRMDGVEVALKIEEGIKAGRFSSIKGVFAVTAGGESHDYEEKNIANQVFDKWLLKPINKKQIIDLLTHDFRHVDFGVTAEVVVKPKKSEVVLETPPENRYSGEAYAEIAVEDIPQQFHHLVPAFIAEMTENLEKLNALNNEKVYENADEIKKIAHYLKGNAMLFQLQSLVEQLKLLETLQISEKDSEKSISNQIENNLEIIQKIEFTVKSLEKSLSISDNKQQ